MKMNKALVLVLLVTLLAITVASQISPPTTISVEDIQDCTTTFYNETENIYGYVTKTRDTYGKCFNPTNQSY